MFFYWVFQRNLLDFNQKYCSLNSGSLSQVFLELNSSMENSLLAEVSHNEAKWNERRETSAGFRRVSYHACPRISLTISDVFCHVWHNPGNRFEFERERLLNLSSRSNFKWTNQSWRWNDLASGRCRGPHYKSPRKAKEANFKANFSFFTNLLTGKSHIFGVKFIGLYGTVGFIAIRDFSFWRESDLWSDVWRVMDGVVPC